MLAKDHAHRAVIAGIAIHIHILQPIIVATALLQFAIYILISVSLRAVCSFDKLADFDGRAELLLLISIYVIAKQVAFALAGPADLHEVLSGDDGCKMREFHGKGGFSTRADD